jgi:hypothetical protein
MEVGKRKSWMDLMMMERVGDRWEKMEGSCSTGRRPQWAVVPVEEDLKILIYLTGNTLKLHYKYSLFFILRIIQNL